MIIFLLIYLLNLYTSLLFIVFTCNTSSLYRSKSHSVMDPIPLLHYHYKAYCHGHYNTYRHGHYNTHLIKCFDLCWRGSINSFFVILRRPCYQRNVSLIFWAITLFNIIVQGFPKVYCEYKTEAHASSGNTEIFRCVQCSSILPKLILFYISGGLETVWCNTGASTQCHRSSRGPSSNLLMWVG